MHKTRQNLINKIIELISTGPNLNRKKETTTKYR